MRPAVTFQVDLLVIQDFPKFRFQKILLTKWNEGVVLTKNVNATEIAVRVPRFSVGRGDVMYDHDADSEACLNRQILNNFVKRKAMEDLCARPRKLIHEELRSQYLDSLL